MIRRLFAVLCLFALALGSQALAGQVMRLATNHTEDFVTGKACAVFADLVKERTKGEIVVEVYYNAVLGDEKVMIEQMQFGAIDFNRTNISPITEFVDEFNALTFPFIYADSAHFWRVMESPDIGMRLMTSDAIKKAGFEGLCYYDNGSRSFFMRNIVVRTPADIKDKNIRVQESSLMVGMIRALGARPTAMPASDLYGALQTGVLDGAENNVPYYLSMSYNEVAPFISLDEHTMAPDALFISNAAKAKLTDEQFKIVQQAALESSQWQRKAWKDSEKEGREKAIQLGCTITDLTPEEKGQFMDMVAPFNAEIGAKYKHILDAIAALK